MHVVDGEMCYYRSKAKNHAVEVKKVEDIMEVRVFVPPATAMVEEAAATAPVHGKEASTGKDASSMQGHGKNATVVGGHGKEASAASALADGHGKELSVVGKRIAGYSRDPSSGGPGLSRDSSSSSIGVHSQAKELSRSSIVGRARSATVTNRASVAARDGVDFEIVYKGGATIVHTTQSTEQRDLFIKELGRLRLENYDVCKRLSMTDASLEAEMRKSGRNADSEAGWFDDVKLAHVVDDGRLGKGEDRALIAVMGRSRITISFVESTWQSLKSDCAFVLDTGNIIYRWYGVNSSRMARAKAMDVAARIRKERSNRPKLQLVEDDDAPILLAFYELLHVDHHAMMSALPDLTDDDYKARTCPVKIYRVIPTAPRWSSRFFLIYEGHHPSKRLLENEAIVVVESYAEVFLWTGKGANAEARSMGLVLARHIALRMRERVEVSGQVFVQRVFHERETAVFREKFADYEGTLPISMRMADAKGNVAAAVKQKPIDPKILLTPLVVEHPAIDNGKGGRSQFFLVKDFAKEPVRQPVSGQFFRGESYIILYTFRPPGSGIDRSVSYFWQGSQSKITEKGTSAMMTVELCKETSGEVTQTRVVEGKGNLGTIIRLGISVDAEAEKYPMAFDVRMTFPGVCKAIETDVGELTFNSSHVSVIITRSVSYVWEGSFSNKAERDHAQLVVKKFSQHSVRVVSDGAADKEFDDTVKALGVKAAEETVKVKKRSIPRLFACASGTGMVTIEEVPQYIQEDLDPHIVMILDAGPQIFIWFGPTSKTNEKVIGMEAIVQYAGLREEKPAVVVTYAYQEPPEFTRCFQGWTRKKFPKDKTNLKVRVRPVDEVLKQYKVDTYPAEVLLSDRLPENVDVTKLEMYLSEEEFEYIFKMKKEDYSNMLSWKREKVKKDVGFF
ncbi:Coronin-2B [Irineochytrium annulatum]|nr:Coronin-2B [Irineochytrium annulatum]